MTRAAKSFVKWVGGKRDQADHILSKMPGGVDLYAELMVGGGSVYWELVAKGFKGTAILSDANADLMLAYRVVRDAPGKLCRALDAYQVEWSRLKDLSEKQRVEFYEDVRYRFTRNHIEGGVDRAAAFLFLNRVCFNGLWRVDAAGRMNAPLGKQSTTKVYERSGILAASRALQGATLVDGPYQGAPLDHLRGLLQKGRRTAFVYFDPPYLPLPGKPSFVDYAKDFGRAEHMQMMTTAEQLSRMVSVTVVVSGSGAPLTRTLMTRHGFEIEEVSARRAINSDPSARGPITELLAIRRGLVHAET